MKKIINKILVTGILALMVAGVCSSQIYAEKRGLQYGYADVKRKSEAVFFQQKSIVSDAAEQIELHRQELELQARREKHILVNKDNPLPEDYEVKLIRLPEGGHRAAEEAYEPLCDMLEDAKAEGFRLKVCSSYRNANYQKRLFDDDIARYMRQGYSYEEAYEKTAELTMPPGYSEHSTGLAFDIVSAGYQGLTLRQEKTKENQWLREHCSEYGFILRYPKGKEEITQINYESWHFRYVGVEAAAYIMEKGITLEEYLEKY